MCFWCFFLWFQCVFVVVFGGFNVFVLVFFVVLGGFFSLSKDIFVCHLGLISFPKDLAERFLSTPFEMGNSRWRLFLQSGLYQKKPT